MPILVLQGGALNGAGLLREPRAWSEASGLGGGAQGPQGTARPPGAEEEEEAEAAARLVGLPGRRRLPLASVSGAKRTIN